MKNYRVPFSHQVFTTEEVRAFDRCAIENHGITGLALMTLAGQFAYDSIRQIKPDAKSMLIFCGLGNNGGDGYIIARLALLDGMQVQLYQLGKEKKLQGDARLAQQLYESQGGVITSFDADNFADAEVDIVVDALLGTGLNRNVEGEYRQAIDRISRLNSFKMAVDIPSGLNADTGQAMGIAVVADASSTYVARKRGMFTGQARDYVGEIYFSDLDIPADVTSIAGIEKAEKCYLIDSKLSALPKRPRSSHKGINGHVLFIGGQPGMSGAIKMAGLAAMHVGAGRVTLLTHPDHANYLNIDSPELMVKGISTARELTPFLSQANVIVIGPGLGNSRWGQELIHACLTTKHDLIVDADGLNLLSKLSAKRENWVLTPHPGEAGRLLGIDAKAIESDRFAAIRHIRRNYSGICVLKGAGTLVSNGKKVAISTLGNPGMSVGGMGDVLSGVIAGLCAQGLSLSAAALLGVSLHAKSADMAADEHGERGLFATDLYPFLRELVN